MKRKIMVVDDSANIRKIIHLTFEGIYEIIPADSGNAALTLIESHGLPDIFLIDVNMPGMSGYELSRILKDSETSALIPLILMIGTFDTYDDELGKKAHHDLIVTKPFDSEFIIRTIDEYLEIGDKRRMFYKSQRKASAPGPAEALHAALPDFDSKSTDAAESSTPSEHSAKLTLDLQTDDEAPPPHHDEEEPDVLDHLIREREYPLPPQPQFVENDIEPKQDLDLERPQFQLPEIAETPPDEFNEYPETPQHPPTVEYIPIPDFYDREVQENPSEVMGAEAHYADAQTEQLPEHLATDHETGGIEGKLDSENYGDLPEEQETRPIPIDTVLEQIGDLDEVHAVVSAAESDEESDDGSDEDSADSLTTDHSNSAESEPDNHDDYPDDLVSRESPDLDSEDEMSEDLPAGEIEYQTVIDALENDAVEMEASEEFPLPALPADEADNPVPEMTSSDHIETRTEELLPIISEDNTTLPASPLKGTIRFSYLQAEMSAEDAPTSSLILDLTPREIDKIAAYLIEQYSEDLATMVAQRIADQVTKQLVARFSKSISDILKDTDRSE